MATWQLTTIDWPAFGDASRPEPPDIHEYRARLASTRSAMAARGLTHLAVYGDREHFASLTWLTNFDPRFEEALLVIAQSGDPLILVGNECESYLKHSPSFQGGELRKERYQPFSLPDQPMDASRSLDEILRDEQLERVGVVDWKIGRIATPSWIVDALRATSTSIEPATDLVHGLRSICSPAEIAYFEYTNTLAAEGARRILFGVRDGIVDTDLMKLAEYNGEPLGCHWTMKSGDHRTSLASACGSTVRRGGPMSFNICYWGSNVCRAGWVVESEDELPVEARGYVAEFAGPYFAACAEWLAGLRVGASAGSLYDLIHSRLPFDRFGIFLNPGHLIHLDEWLAAPFYKGSQEALRSGMAIQSDVIPSAPRFFSTRMEDGYALADASLRAEMAERYPAVAKRCEARREFMADVLGIRLHEDVLPLANTCGIVPPFFLRPTSVFRVAS